MLRGMLFVQASSSCNVCLTRSKSGSQSSGRISVSRCGQEVLERTACCLDPTHGDLCLRLEVGLPAQGRTIQARELEKILFDFFPSVSMPPCSIGT